MPWRSPLLKAFLSRGLHGDLTTADGWKEGDLTTADGWKEGDLTTAHGRKEGDFSPLDQRCIHATPIAV
jgi:hypothetical protein